jgi:hypothetical protein
MKAEVVLLLYQAMKIVLVYSIGMVTVVLDVTTQDVTTDKYQDLAGRLTVCLVAVTHVAETVAEWA